MQTGDVKVGDTVTLRGHRSNCNARKAAVGVVKEVRASGRFDVEAGVNGHGLVLLVGLTKSDIRRGAD